MCDEWVQHRSVLEMWCLVRVSRALYGGQWAYKEVTPNAQWEAAFQTLRDWKRAVQKKNLESKASKSLNPKSKPSKSLNPKP